MSYIRTMIKQKKRDHYYYSSLNKCAIGEANNNDEITTIDFNFEFKTIESLDVFLQDFHVIKISNRRVFDGGVDILLINGTPSRLWTRQDNMTENGIIVMASLTISVNLSDESNIDYFLNISTDDMIGSIELHDMKYFINNKRVKSIIEIFQPKTDISFLTKIKNYVGNLFD